MHDLLAIIQNTNGPIIELGGPTPEGYDLLDKHGLHLPEKTIITNKAREFVENPFSDNGILHIVDEVANIMALPYKDESVELYFASNIPMTTLDGFQIKDDAERLLRLDEWRKKAAEEAQKILGGKFEGKPKYNLHACLFLEASRTLKRPGYFLYQGVRSGDRELANYYGFEELIINRSIDSNEVIQSILFKTG